MAKNLRRGRKQVNILLPVPVFRWATNAARRAGLSRNEYLNRWLKWAMFNDRCGFEVRQRFDPDIEFMDDDFGDPVVTVRRPYPSQAEEEAA